MVLLHLAAVLLKVTKLTNFLYCSCSSNNECRCVLIAAKDGAADEDKSTMIDGALGEGSQFHTTYGFYAQGVDSQTAKLPLGWEGRLHRVQN